MTPPGGLDVDRRFGAVDVAVPFGLDTVAVIAVAIVGGRFGYVNGAVVEVIIAELDPCVRDCSPPRFQVEGLSQWLSVELR